MQRYEINKRYAKEKNFLFISECKSSSTESRFGKSLEFRFFLILLYAFMKIKAA